MHELALAKADIMGIDITALSEPNKKALANRKDWIKDDKLNNAMKILGKNINIETQWKGTGFSHIQTNDFTIHTWYMSQNQEITELESTRNERGQRL